LSTGPQSDLLRYDQMLQKALRGVLKETLDIVAQSGLPGTHHLYITFRTQASGVEIADYLVARYPEEMTIVLQHEYWGLEADDEGFSVTLSFSNRHERLVIPWTAVTAFADPSVRFGLQIDKAAQSERAEDEEEVAESEEPAEEAVDDAAPQSEESGKVVALDRFRKKEG